MNTRLFTKLAKRAQRFALAGLLALLFTPSQQEAVAAGNDPIKIGAILSVTGPAGFLGDPEAKTLTLYVDKINQAGGVLGRKLELITYDDGSDAAKANEFAKKLIEFDKVDLIIGATTSAGTMGIILLVEAAKIPTISLAGAAAIINPVKPFVFKTPQTESMAITKIFQELKRRNITKIALISETSAYGQDGRKETLSLAPQFGIELVSDETFGSKDPDVTAQLSKIKNTVAAQALLIFGSGQAPATVTRNYAQLGMKLPIYLTHGVASSAFLKLAGASVEGARVTSPPLLIADKLPAKDPVRAVALAYIKDYQAKYNDVPSTFGGYAYDALNIAVAAMKRANGTESDALRRAIEETKAYVGATGTFNMSASDHLGLNMDAFYMVEVRNGDWQLVN